MTGKESYYTVYAGHEVMYHVSTMLPYSKDNPQQLERKRHIGNDIVNIVYTDDSDAIDTFNPNCIRSQFTRKFSILLPISIVEPSPGGYRANSDPSHPLVYQTTNITYYLLISLLQKEKRRF